MDACPNVQKKAFLARINELRKCKAVDTRYVRVGEKTKLILVFEDGTETEFKGLRAA